MAGRGMMVGLLLCVLALASPFLAVSVDVCPANSQFKSLPFLKAAQPGALKPLTENGFKNIDITAVTSFIQKTLVPMIGANVFFFALAALFLIIFILWRFLRYCCYMICCKSSCDKRRAERNPYKLLFNKGTKVLKGFMCLFGLVAIAFAIYGMASVKKNLTDDAFTVVMTLSNYTTGVTDTMDRLMGTISGVSTIIDDFQAIIEDDLEIDALLANLTDIGAFLDASNPAVLQADVTALKAAFNTGFKNSLTALNTAVTTFGTDKTTMDADLSTLTTATSKLDAMKTFINDVQTASAAIDFAVAVWGSDGTRDINMGALKTKIEALTNARDAATPWSTQLTSIGAAVDGMAGRQTAPTNPFTKLKTAVNNVLTANADVVTKITALKAKINTMTADFTGVQSKMGAIMNKMDYVNATVIALTGPMETARSSLTTANTTMVNVFSQSPTPNDVADQLVAFTSPSGMPATTNLVDLRDKLASAEALLTDAPYTAYQSSYTGASGWLTTVQSHITALGPLLATFKAHLDAYHAAVLAGNVSATEWDPMKTTTAGTSYTPFKSALNALWTTAPAGDFASSTYAGTSTGSVSDIGTKSAAIKTEGDTAGAATGAATIFTAAAAGTTLPAAVTNLDGYITTMVTAFQPFGSPPSAVISGPASQLGSIKTAAIDTGNSVKTTINNTISGVRGSINNLKTQVTGQLDSVEDTYKPTVQTVDGYRYSASMALYGVSILFVLLILLSAYLNYHFGANFNTFWLLIITVLYFLLALLIALLVAILYLGCDEIEPIIIQMAPASFTPLLNYYFGDQTTTASVKTVLKDAGIVDIDKTLSEVTQGQAHAVQGLTSGFIFRAKPLAVIGRINTTVDDVNAGVEQLLGKASREQLMPVYGEVKGLICCMVPDIFASMWIGLTFAGVFAFALNFCTFFFIGKIDKAPRKDCCGCTCHTEGKYVGTVYPDTLPQFNQPGFDNPLGPYEAPMNGAMWAGEGGEAHVTVSAGMVNSAQKDY